MPRAPHIVKIDKIGRKLSQIDDAKYFHDLIIFSRENMDWNTEYSILSGYL